MSGEVTIGVVSLAHPHAFSYLAALAAMPGVQVVGVDPGADGEPGRGRETIEATGARSAGSYEELLALGPDGVIVCSENVRHRAHTETALRAGAHVLCEKPLATDPVDAAAMVATAEEVGRRLMVAHPVRFSTAFTALQEAYVRGDLGRLLAVTGTNNGRLPLGRDWFTDQALAGGGAVTDHTVHVADLLDALLDGAEPVSVLARANRVLHGDDVEVETAGLVQVTYAGGVVATIDCSWSRPDDYPTWGGLTLDLVGTGGTAHMDAFVQRVDGHRRGHGQVWFDHGENADGAMIAEFLDVVRTGREPHPDGRAGVRGTTIVAAAYESIRTGRRVQVSSAT